MEKNFFYIDNKYLLGEKILLETSKIIQNKRILSSKYLLQLHIENSKLKQLIKVK